MHKKRILMFHKTESARFVKLESGFGALDYCAVVLAIVGLVFAYRADTEFEDYMAENRRRRKSTGEKVLPLLNTGVWALSRHPDLVQH